MATHHDDNAKDTVAASYGHSLKYPVAIIIIFQSHHGIKYKYLSQKLLQMMASSTGWIIKKVATHDDNAKDALAASYGHYLKYAVIIIICHGQKGSNVQ